MSIINRKDGRQMSNPETNVNTTRGITAKERVSYMLYFLGQNIFYMLTYSYMNTYFTDMGITTAAVGIIVLIVKIWDAINDPIFGGIVDKVHMKGGKFVPWLRIAVPVLLVANVVLFSIPAQVSSGVKIAWAILAYGLWSVGYTMNDVPIFGLITTITEDQDERTSLNASGRVAAMIAALVVSIIIPVFRNAIGGWTLTVLVLSVIGAALMFPIGITAKERVKATENQQQFSFRDMFSYLISNKFLLIYYVAFMISGALNVSSSWGMYIARYCLGNESIMSITSILGILPAIVIGVFVPMLCRKMDKFRLYYIATVLMLAMNILRWIVGYHNLASYIVMAALIAIPTGLTTVLAYMFTPDCAEYGHYKTGKSYPGITFATQTFFAKLQSAVLSAVAAFALGFTGFIEGESSVQVEGFADALWNVSCILPIVGFAVALVILHFYKLNDHDVQLMTKVNNGEMTREDAQAQMKYNY